MKHFRRLAIVGGMLALTAIVAKAQDGTTLEAEDTKYENCVVVADTIYSGGKALDLLENNSKITFAYTAAEKGKYTIYVGYDGCYGEKPVRLAVNGGSGTFRVSGHAEAAVGTYFMAQGDNTIEITPGWTYFRIDYIRIESAGAPLPFSISQAPVDAQAADCARKLYAFLYDHFGKKTISGIMTGDMTAATGDITRHADVKAVYEASGKYPALIGFDFMNTTGQNSQTDWYRSYSDAVMALARDTWRRGGIPAFTWHWRDPSLKTNEFYYDERGKNDKGETRTTLKISEAMNADGSWNTSSAVYQRMVSDIDVIADHFLQLQAEGIACIFRPLHEAGGGWFWWGADGAENCVKLFRLIYDEMVTAKGVHNLIWVWNPSEQFDDWNPGEAYYDVVSADIYNAAFDYSSNYVMFERLKTLTGGRKIIALSENGPVPDIDRQVDEEAMWSWWMPWYQTWNGKFVDQTSREQWTKCMGDPRVITLDDMTAGWEASTAIGQMTAKGSAPQAVYDLQGRLLSTAPASGLYVKGGKTIVAH